MAKPKIKDGYTRIVNPILENLVKSGLNGSELAIVLHIVRKTYGFQKKQDEISISQFLKAIPITRQTLCTSIKNLKLMNIIRLVRKGKHIFHSNLWEFNKNYDDWQIVKKYRRVNKNKITSKFNHAKLVIKPRPTKDNTKDNTKDIVSNFDTEEFKNFLLKNDLKYLQIIGHYMKFKNIKFLNHEQAESFKSRNLKPALILKGYSITQIIKTMEYLKINANYKWSLETIGKFIDEKLDILNPKINDDEELINKIINK